MNSEIGWWQSRGYIVQITYFPGDKVLPGRECGPDDSPDHVVVTIFAGDQTGEVIENPRAARSIAEGIGTSLDNAIRDLHPTQEFSPAVSDPGRHAEPPF
ncbi:hypothetical protein [Amycolatopsis saalfeldensis]|uniref:hypothetical protein n=1 Tax=Amycolatopsis saalfeldensis TaxID=394193 RepID=UPI0011607161|nr:hypothetical protein [Amycolatopsis saalfeldensis]